MGEDTFSSVHFNCLNFTKFYSKMKINTKLLKCKSINNMETALNINC